MKKFFIAVFLLFITACLSHIQTNEFWIQNPQNQSIFVKADGLENASHHKLAIIQHGLASNMNHVAVQEAKKAFLDNHYVVITFDSRYSLGEGNNDVEKVQLKTFTEDLETIVNWAKKQPFYAKPFALAGHSLGGASVIKFSAKYPEYVSVLVPITPVISGKSWEKSCMKNLGDFCLNWKQKGTYQYTDEQNHKTATIPFSVVTSCTNYDAYKIAKDIRAETLFIGAEKDIIINPNDIMALSKTFSKGSMSIIKYAGHNFEDKQKSNRFISGNKHIFAINRV